MNQKERPHPTNHAGAITSDFQPPELWAKFFLLFMRCPVSGVLLQRLERTKMRQRKVGLAYITAVLAPSIKAASCSPK